MSDTDALILAGAQHSPGQPMRAVVQLLDANTVAVDIGLFAGG